MDIYFSTDAPVVNIDLLEQKVKIGTSTGQTQNSTGTGDLDIPHLLLGFPIKGHPMPGFRHTVIGVGALFDANCTVTFTFKAIII